MSQEHIDKPSNGVGDTIPVESLDSADSIADCCKGTIDLLAENNPMMVCGTCKQIIKCFREQSKFMNYSRFCKSRHRTILTGFYGKMYVVTFKSYDTYST